jgi:transposase-like protein
VRGKTSDHPRMGTLPARPPGSVSPPSFAISMSHEKQPCHQQMSAKPLKTKRPPAPPTAKPANISQLARELGVSRESLRKWKLEGVDLSNPKQVGERMARMTNSPPSGDMATARLRKLTAEASRQELALQREQGEVVPVSEVLEAFAMLGAVVRAATMRLVANLPQMLEGVTPAQAQHIIRDQASSVLEALADKEDSLWKDK